MWRFSFSSVLGLPLILLNVIGRFRKVFLLLILKAIIRILLLGEFSYNYPLNANKNKKKKSCCLSEAFLKENKYLLNFIIISSFVKFSNHTMPFVVHPQMFLMIIIKTIEVFFAFLHISQADASFFLPQLIKYENLDS